MVSLKVPTERHTADTQITDSTDYKISAVRLDFTIFSRVCYLLHIGLITLITIILIKARIHQRQLKLTVG
jgi:hypothetical protein